MTEEQQVRLLQALAEMDAAPLAAESPEVCAYIAREDLDLEARAALLDRFYQDHVFTEYLGYNLEAHLLYSTADQEKMARFAGSMAASALNRIWASAADSTTVEPDTTLLFLESVFNKGNVSIATAMAEGIDDILAAHPLNLVPFLAPASSYPRAILLDAMQTCITLGVFLEKKEGANWFELTQNTATFFERTHIWLFDGGALSAEHLENLECLFNAIPISLHGIMVLHFPEHTGVGVEETTLRVPGISLNIPAIEMDILRELPVFTEDTPPAFIPEFTAVLLESLSRAVHTRQFGLRPDLYRHMQTFFSLMDTRPAPEFLSFFPPQLAHHTPEERMAYLGYLWLANSRTLLETAVSEVEQRQARSLLFALLLEADIWSETKDATLLFRTNPAGVLFTERTALRRGGAAPDTLHVNGIALSGKIWQYELGDMIGTPLGR